MGTATAHTQVAAERLGLDMDAITFNYADSTLPGVVLAGGSQQTASIGAAIIAAHRALVAELLKLAGNDSPLAGLDVDAVRKRKADEGQVGDDITGEELLELDVDLLIPAALEDAITEDNAGDVRASVVVEVANGPVTSGADASHRDCESSTAVSHVPRQSTRTGPRRRRAAVRSLDSTVVHDDGLRAWCAAIRASQSGSESSVGPGAT